MKPRKVYQKSHGRSADQDAAVADASVRGIWIAEGWNIVREGTTHQEASDAWVAAAEESIREGAPIDVESRGDNGPWPHTVHAVTIGRWLEWPASDGLRERIERAIEAGASFDDLAAKFPGATVHEGHPDEEAPRAH